MALAGTVFVYRGAALLTFSSILWRIVASAVCGPAYGRQLVFPTRPITIPESRIMWWITCCFTNWDTSLWIFGLLFCETKWTLTALSINIGGLYEVTLLQYPSKTHTSVASFGLIESIWFLTESITSLQQWNWANYESLPIYLIGFGSVAVGAMPSGVSKLNRACYRLISMLSFRTYSSQRH